MIRVSVVYALPDAQYQVAMDCPEGATIADALAQMALDDSAPEVLRKLDTSAMEVGIYGFRRQRDEALADGDRIEIYRPLEMSPTEARRLRAEARKVK